MFSVHVASQSRVPLFLLQATAGWLEPQENRQDENGLFTSSLRLRFSLLPRLLEEGDLRVLCVAEIEGVYREASEEMLLISPRYQASVREGGAAVGTPPHPCHAGLLALLTLLVSLPPAPAMTISFFHESLPEPQALDSILYYQSYPASCFLSCLSFIFWTHSPAALVSFFVTLPSLPFIFRLLNVLFRCSRLLLRHPAFSPVHLSSHERILLLLSSPSSSCLFSRSSVTSRTYSSAALVSFVTLPSLPSIFHLLNVLFCCSPLSQPPSSPPPL
ncbi:hypothetical protein C7M84_000378 [Penaeus vannamei]|uniref:Uncharacterized protein n=1 Tax=Penaeus vannamei TaxID=6689 RepID=A0A3R7PYC2_PENVA|nr:hypothetical protein C7M84_000378 [Penaeus vannamei]